MYFWVFNLFLKAAWFVLYSGVWLGQLIEPDNDAEMNETCIVTQFLMLLLPVRNLHIFLQDCQLLCSC